MTITATHDLGNFGSEAVARAIGKAIEGETYFDIQVAYSPDCGNWGVEVYTEYEGAEQQDFQEMVAFVLADKLGTLLASK